MIRLYTLFLLLGVALTSSPTVAQQQSQGPEPVVRSATETYAITNARVVQAPGRVLDNATIVVHNGLIQSVGTNVRVPRNARIIDGDGLVVYAAFIDALGTVGLDVPRVDTSERVPDPDNPPRERAGIVPDRQAHLFVDPSSDAIERLRNVGFGAAHVAPTTGMFSGQSAVILLAGDFREDMVLEESTTLVARFAGGSGVFPGTPMAIAAEFRERYNRTAQWRDASGRYSSNATGRVRPSNDPVSAALLPSLERRQPVVFVANSVQEGQRALRLTDEIGLNVILAGPAEPSMLIGTLRDQNVAFLAPLNLPDAVKDSVDTPLASAPGRQTHSHADVDRENDRLRFRYAEVIAQYESGPAALAEAGIPFAFATLEDAPSDPRAIIRRMIAAGLDEDAALAALTTAPAELLRIDNRLGTIEAGKIANLVILNGDLFDEESAIRYVIVDGERFEQRERRRADPAAEVTAEGTWQITILVEDDSISGRLTIEKTGDVLTGNANFPELGNMDMSDITLSGNELTFTLDSPFGAAAARAVIDGDTMEGTINVPQMPAVSFTATRQPD